MTNLAKWKTTLQMVAIAVLFLGTGLSYVAQGQSPRVGETGIMWSASLDALATHVGLILIWIAAGLTAWTGWDYFIKALPYLREPANDA